MNQVDEGLKRVFITHSEEEEKSQCFELLHGIWRVCKIQVFFIFKILPMLTKYRILLLGNAVEMAGGWHIFCPIFCLLFLWKKTFISTFKMEWNSLGREVIFFFAALYCSCLGFHALLARDCNKGIKFKKEVRSVIKRAYFGIKEWRTNYNSFITKLFFFKQGSMLYWASFEAKKTFN